MKQTNEFWLKFSTRLRIGSISVGNFTVIAIGTILNDHTIPQLKCNIICGSANNQLASTGHGTRLFNDGFIYAPDYLANAGGVMNVAREFEWVRTDFHVANMLDNIYDRMSEVVLKSMVKKISTSEIADEMALNRLED